MLQESYPKSWSKPSDQSGDFQGVPLGGLGDMKSELPLKYTQHRKKKEI
ncbi:MAG: hypothetical protein IJ228_06550 [Succinivibrio sp.]|nr:hypothetical protein [Succinivibrio sp.]